MNLYKNQALLNYFLLKLTNSILAEQESNTPNVSKSLYELMQQSSDFYAMQLNRSQTARQYLESLVFRPL